MRRADGLCRAYALVVVPTLKDNRDIHVKRNSEGQLSGCKFERLKVGDEADFHSPCSENFYYPRRVDQPLLLIGSGTSLGPLAAIARRASEPQAADAG